MYNRSTLAVPDMQTVCEAEEIPSLSSEELSFGSRSKSLLSDSSSLTTPQHSDQLKPRNQQEDLHHNHCDIHQL